MAISERKLTPFAYGDREPQAAAEFDKLVADATDKARERFIDQRNVYMYKHGNVWRTSHNESYAQMYKFEAESKISIIDIVDHRLALIDEHVDALAGAFASQFAANLFRTLDEVTEKTGNVVDMANEPDFATGIRRALEQIQWGVDRYGKATPPQMHVGSKAFEKIKSLIESSKEQGECSMSELSARKELEALSREADRISKYRFIP